MKGNRNSRSCSVFKIHRHFKLFLVKCMYVSYEISAMLSTNMTILVAFIKERLRSSGPASLPWIKKSVRGFIFSQKKRISEAVQRNSSDMRDTLI